LGKAELCEKVLKIEQLFGMPQDVEWCSLASKLFILQSRPITSELRLGEVADAKLGTEGVTLRGYGAAPGITTGTTFIVEDELAVGAFPDGAILLAPSTDTDYLSAMQRASAIVTEEGGLLSHAAIIARELSIPCVVGATDALVQFPTGTLITVDGYTGTIKTGKAATRGLILDLHDQSDLFCFDSLQLIYIYDALILLEPAYSGSVIYMPSTVSEEKAQMIVSTIQEEISSKIRFGPSSKYHVYFS
jgi:phosphohistidine swiveling domain-containing protein